MTALFDGLFDDAALFPPGNSPMGAAVPAHRALQARLAPIVGPFVLPAARLDELLAHLDGEPIRISLITPAGDLRAATSRVAADPRLTLAAVELPVVDRGVAAAEALRILDQVLPADVPAAVEVPRTGARDEVLDVLAGSRYRAKLRTGGLRTELFPSVAEFADALAACVRRGIAVKCTAGLHHAVRHTDPATGFAHHGFLNVLAAAEALSDGASTEAVTRVLGESDPTVVVGQVRSWNDEHVARARATFTSFGTCNIIEPVDDVVRLGLLSLPERTAG